MAASRDQLLRELLLLSSKTHLYPSCLTFSDVKRSKKAVAPGRFGEVYRGSIHERPVALKIFKVYCQNDFQKITKAVSKEAILWGQLDHRNILPLYGLCNPIGSQYFGMVFPWMENGNVLHYLKANRSVNRLSLVSDVAQGVSYLHEQRIVHGDLKGMNILVTESGHACLTDFGLASLIERTEIVSWTSVQRVANHSDMIRWQAPECFRDPENNVSPYVTTHADMWAFACVCYEITTGNVPFYEYSRDTTVLKQLTTGQKPSKPAPDSDAFTTFGLTEDLWSLMDRCWSPQPQSRPTAREVLDSEPLHIQRDSRPQFRWDVKGSRFRLGVKQWIAVSQ
ncbi:kinase-like protein [Coprinopsis marcescibilis]|uniref:Kinase-like protein n=1 Tax=Coprinopsis marcescibilis TaxID=230819 RepID=A0A5C3KHN3_COPMA|nr:kinase-like protein [Coprinopsis marcescibilis]